MFQLPLSRKLIATSLLSATCLMALSSHAQAASCPAAVSGTITASGNYDATCVVGAGESITVSGDIIAAAGNSVSATSGTFGNITTQTGSLLDGDYGLHLDGVIGTDITLAGSIIGTDGGVSIDDSIIDNLTMTGGDVTAAVGVILNDTTITNNFETSASIYGSYFGIAMTGTTIQGGLYNSGIIEGNLVGLLLDQSSATGGISNEAGGIIRGTNSSITVTNASGSHFDIYNYGIFDGDAQVVDVDLYFVGQDTRLIGYLGGDADTNVIFGRNLGGGNFELTDMDLEDEMEANSFTILENATVRPNGYAFYLNSTFVNQGTIDVEDRSTYIDGDYEQASGAILSLEAIDTNDYGYLEVAGTATMSDGAGIFVDVVDSDINFAENDRLTEVLRANEIDLQGDLDITTNSVLFAFTYELVNSDRELDLIFARAPDSSVSESLQNQGNSAGSNAAVVLDDLINNNPGGNFNELINAFGALTTDEEISNAVTQSLPALIGSATQATMNTITSTGNIVQARQEGNLGLSSGEGFITNGNAWVKPFGSWASHDSQGSTPGFKSNSFGIVAGADAPVSDTLRLGAAFTYANSNANGKGASAGQGVDVDSYYATLYSSYTLTEDTELNFRVGGGLGKNDSTRHISFGGFSGTAKGEYDSYAFDLGAGIGQTISVSPELTLTPSVRVDYALVKNESYTETGAGAFNQNLDDQTTDQLVPSIESKAHYQFSKSFSGTVNAGIGYDLLSDGSQVTSSFVGGGSSFTTEGLDTSPWVPTAGAGLYLYQANGAEFSTRYDLEARGTDYTNQTVSLKYRQAF